MRCITGASTATVGLHALPPLNPNSLVLISPFHMKKERGRETKRQKKNREAGTKVRKIDLVWGLDSVIPNALPHFYGNSSFCQVSTVT